jgi:hypothetical protein
MRKIIRCIEADQIGPDFDYFADSTVGFYDAAHESARNRDRGFVRHHVNEWLIDANFLPRRNMPGDDFGFDDAFTQVRKSENYALHRL